MQTILDLIPAAGDNRFRPEHTSVSYFAGLDLGQRRDHTALAILERNVAPTGEFDNAAWQTLTRVDLRMRHLGRMPLDTPYTAIAEAVAARMEKPPLAGRTMLAVDATGVGLPVVDHLKSLKPPCRIVPVIISSGDHPNWSRGIWSVPRRELVANLQIMMESRALAVARRTRHAKPFEEELSCFGTSASLHDDLVFAAALAAFLARNFGALRGYRL